MTDYNHMNSRTSERNEVIDFLSIVVDICLGKIFGVFASSMVFAYKIPSSKVSSVFIIRVVFVVCKLRRMFSIYGEGEVTMLKMLCNFYQKPNQTIQVTWKISKVNDTNNR